ncbi:tetratricopeptide repeat protein [Sedimentitalea sp. JM2-8]|uniref:Tetratricopeptide repeat protein n=1 Tax=Sedimentitalea xiamensis TaxID=3050037 RepID=A0ABT7FKH3_9RHOB|nr:tetratricopeptide repeat protein [Sedimentitalea xiamensis]MDK3075269.1 tetratricopeptide repeat protein [Sedimentitalea xiamensis]
MTFDKPVDAVRWVREVQMESRRRRHGLMLRAALNYCRVLRDGNDLLGDGVNIAARLQEHAPVGGVILTEAVREWIVDDPELETRPLGSLALRKMKKTVTAYELVTDGRPTIIVASEQTSLPSIAVMPFFSGDGQDSDGYFASGIVEDIISRLSRLNDLTVISRSSTLAFANQPANPQSLAEVLGVRYLITGVLRQAGPQYRLSAELLDTQNGQVLASLRRDFVDADTFAVQDEIVEAALSHLLPGLRAAERRRSLRKAPASFTAYDSYLRALDLIGSLEPGPFREARIHLQSAMDGDPTFSPPFAWAARWHSLNVGQGWSGDPAGEAERAAVLAQQAIRLDDMDARALATFGHVQAFMFGDFDTALTYLDRARQANPSSSTAWLLSSVTLSSLGRAEEGIAAAERALRLSPFDPRLFQYYVFLGIVHYDAGDYQSAVKWLSMGLAENPRYTSGLRALAVAQEALGEHAAASAAAGRLLELEPGFSLALYRGAHRLYSDPEKADLFFERLQRAGVPE